ncbi:LysM peptidoglycan-binding domain-containing protein, partial [Acinetobacter baumannii]
RPPVRQIAMTQPTRNDAATAPVPQARMNWQAGAQATHPGAAPQPQAHARTQAARPASHTVVMGESLGSIATKYGVTRQQLASANSLQPN